MFSKTIVSLLALSLLVPMTAFGDGNPATDGLSRVIPYDGALEFDGNVVNGDVSMRFSLYLEGGSVAQWQEEYSAQPERSCSDMASCSVPFYAGRFSVLLGQYEPISNVILDAENLELGIEVMMADGSDWVALNGRQRITPTAYALWSTGAADFHVARNLTADGDMELGGNMTVGGDAAVSGNMHVSGDTNISGRVETSSDVTVGDDLDVGRYITVEGSDIALGTDDGRYAGTRTRQRALVHSDGVDRLVVNYQGDFEGGVLIDSGLYVNGDFELNRGFCVLRAASSCPSGFSQSSITIDAEDDSNNSSHSGDIGSSVVLDRGNVTLELCCR